MKDGSVDNMEESPKTISVDNPREDQRKDEGEALNRGGSDNTNLDNLTSGNNAVRGLWWGHHYPKIWKCQWHWEYGWCNGGKDLHDGEGVSQFTFHWNYRCNWKGLQGL